MWLLKSKTTYLNGLNYRQGNEYKKEDTHFFVGNKFKTFPRKQDRVSRGTIHENHNSFCLDGLFIKLKHHRSHNLSDAPNFYRVFLLAMSNYNLKNTTVLLQDKLDDDKNFIYFQFDSLALDIIESKVFKPKISKTKRRRTYKYL